MLCFFIIYLFYILSKSNFTQRKWISHNFIINPTKYYWFKLLLVSVKLIKLPKWTLRWIRITPVSSYVRISCRLHRIAVHYDRVRTATAEYNDFLLDCKFDFDFKHFCNWNLCYSFRVDFSNSVPEGYSSRSIILTWLRADYRMTFWRVFFT